MEFASLKKLLSDYQANDPAEAAYRQQMLLLLDGEDLAWQRGHYTPGHFTASAFVVDRDSRELAMIYHTHLKRWLQPGGHIEPGDSDPFASAKRELLEETGLDIPGDFHLVDLDIHDIPARGGFPPHKHFDLRFAHILPSSHPRPELHPDDDAVHAGWKPLDSLLNHDEPGMSRIANKLLRYLNQTGAGIFHP